LTTEDDSGSALDLVRGYLTSDEQQRLRELEAAVKATQGELTSDETLRLVGLLSRGLLELVSNRQKDESVSQFSSAVSQKQRELLEQVAEALRRIGTPPSAPQASTRRRRSYIGACPECGSQAGLHALSCSRYRSAAPPPPLTEGLIAELRALPASQWSGWPPDDYDQSLPLVELRQDHLASLLAEVEEARRRR
jgi:hypothetical protein